MVTENIATIDKSLNRLTLCDMRLIFCCNVSYYLGEPLNNSIMFLREQNYRKSVLCNILRVEGAYNKLKVMDLVFLK